MNLHRPPYPSQLQNQTHSITTNYPHSSFSLTSTHTRRSGRGEEGRGGGFDACGRGELLAEELVDAVIVRGEVKEGRGWQRGPFLFRRAYGEDVARVVLAYHSSFILCKTHTIYCLPQGRVWFVTLF
ncbi:hypothetical protein QVD17_19744 [Tagetes erecta]|uniref:Uncharacterized protein n=1 Tax=Tagetes erecta TaxID=13708 RepID=A0AAD8KK03_TARER|nr:hypothetical protein QVD17_19744 [Tagetes erecta]